MKCPECQINESSGVDPEYGLLKCLDCLLKDDTIEKPRVNYDFASPSTKQQRKEFGAEMFQPYVNGVLSKEYVDTWGTDKLYGVTDKDVKKAKYVYKNHTRHHKMLESGKKKAQEIYGGTPKDTYTVKEH